MTCLVFKTMYIDRGKPLREGAFSFTRRTLFPPLDKRNTRDKAKGLHITSARHSGELGVRYLSPLNIEDRILGNSRIQRARREERKEKPHGLPIEGSRGADVWCVTLPQRA